MRGLMYLIVFLTHVLAVGTTIMFFVVSKGNERPSASVSCTPIPSGKRGLSGDSVTEDRALQP